MSSIDPGSLTPLKILTSPIHNIQYTPLKTPPIQSATRRLSSPRIKLPVVSPRMKAPLNSPPMRLATRSSIGSRINGLPSPVKSKVKSPSKSDQGLITDKRKVCRPMLKGLFRDGIHLFGILPIHKYLLVQFKTT